MELLGDKNWWMPELARPDHPPPRHRRHTRRSPRTRRSPSTSSSRSDMPDLKVPDLTMEADMHVYQPTITRSRTWPQIALRWMPTFLGFPHRRLRRRDRRTRRRRRTGHRRRRDHRRHPRLRAMARHAPHRSTAAPRGSSPQRSASPSDSESAPRAVGYDTSTGALAVQGAICGAVHRRRASGRPAPAARTDRVGVAGRRSPRCGHSAGRSPRPPASTSSRSTPSSARAGRSSSPPAHRCWRSRSPAERNVASTTDDRDEGGREGLSRRGSCRPCGRCAHVPSS